MEDTPQEPDEEPTQDAEGPWQSYLDTILAGRYKLVRLLGAGGMGAVFEAEDRHFENARRAVKVLHRVHRRRPTMVARFRREAEYLTRRTGSGTLSVLDQSQDDDPELFFVMQIARGAPLTTRGLRAPDEPAAAWIERLRGYTVDLLETLEALHAEMVHRDLKPDNLLVVTDAAGREHVVVIDFGIAQVLAAPPLTALGEVLGTPQFMPPEQLRDAGLVDARGDLYSVGATLFRLLTGRYVADGARGAVMVRVSLGQIERDARVYNSDVPTWFARCVIKALQLDPAARFQSARELREALERGSEEPPPAPIPPTEAAPPPVLLEAAPAAEPPPEAPPSYTAPIARPSRRWWAMGLGAVTAAAVALLVLRSNRCALGINFAGCGDAFPATTALVRGGTFTMGSSATEVTQAQAECRAQDPDAANCADEIFARERPERLVTVADFRLDLREVTHEAFVAWLRGQGPVLEPAVGPLPARLVAQGRAMVAVRDPSSPFARYGGVVAQSGAVSVLPGFERLPVVRVTWDGAATYCAARGGRLPTEAEWEYAARGSAGRRYPWGDAPPRSDGVVFLRGASTQPLTAASDLQDCSPDGVQDLAGRVSEWTADRYIAANAPDDLRVLRGGSWHLGASALRGSARVAYRADGMLPDVGFRCAYNVH
ncbi:MAG: SUMF1/EgtB/PvdO family nonheme iron enzyme [Deltaproteobacteria bacterium]|nr:SUMF1/EgtB/PvdO family nonheme iron enzyme [Deltaproteobacteria bacterium]